MADQVVKFVSTSELNAKKDEKRKAREKILDKAKADYEREERRRAKRKETGEDTWMLPSLSERVSDDHPKKKKRKKEKKSKDKKDKKQKKKSKKEKEASSDSDSSDEWVEKGDESIKDDTKNDANEKKESAAQRDSWMMFPCFSGSTRTLTRKEVDEPEEKQEEKKLSAIDMAGQHARELNPYWKDGGVGLPTDESETTKIPSVASIVYDVKWLKKSLQRSIEQAEQEGRPLEDIVAERWGSLEHLKTMISEAESRSSEERGKNQRNWDCERDRRVDKERSRSRHSEREDTDRGRRRDDKGDRERYRDYDKQRHEVNDRDRSGIQSRRTERRVEDRRDNNRDSENISRGGHDKIRSSYSRTRADKMPSRTDTNMFRRPDTSSGRSDSLSSLKFKKPGEGVSSSSTGGSSMKWDPNSKTGTERGSKYEGWKKKNPSDETSTKTNRIEQALKKRKEKKEKNEETSSSESSESEVDEVSEKNKNPMNQTKMMKEDESEGVEREVVASAEPTVPKKRVTEADLNSMGAKILRAELMGNEDLASELKATLEQMRKDKEVQEASGSMDKERREEEVVVLTRTDKFGNTRPVNISERPESHQRRRKKEKSTTHDKSGQRERYFADDDRYDLKEMVRREKMNTAEDYDSMFSRLASKGATKTDSDDFTLDDHFVTGAANKLSKAKEEERDRMRAIREHQRLSEQLSKCKFCFENPDLAKHLIIAIGIQVYLALPIHTSLTEGHCLIVPMQHQVASTYLDENVVDEIKVFKKGLTRLFLDMDKDVVFLETCRNIARQNHMIIECVPLPKEEGEMAPMYFKKAILESESEWAQNKKLVDTREKGLRGSIPKGLPYFSVEFGLDGGYAHVIEDEHAFPHYFGKEIIGGMLDLEPRAWHKPHKENFEQHKKKVLQFADWWKPYDWTKRLSKNKQ